MPVPIVDTHVHLWDPAQFRYRWLDGLPALNRAFRPADSRAASASADVSKFIFVECGREPAQILAEVDWVSKLTKSDPWLKGIVAHASLERGDGARAELEILASRSLVKGVRRNLQSEQDPEFCLRPKFLAGVEADCRNWQAAEFMPYLRHALASFGTNRLMFGSDWPVMTLATDYQRWVETVRTRFPLSKEKDWEQLFYTNAERNYRV